MAGLAGIEPTSLGSKPSILSVERKTDYVAGPQGFEPRLTESKSVVLPLHYGPTKWLPSLGSNQGPND